MFFPDSNLVTCDEPPILRSKYRREVVAFLLKHKGHCWTGKLASALGDNAVTVHLYLEDCPPNKDEIFMQDQHGHFYEDLDYYVPSLHQTGANNPIWTLQSLEGNNFAELARFGLITFW